MGTRVTGCMEEDLDQFNGTEAVRYAMLDDCLRGRIRIFHQMNGMMRFVFRL